MLLSLLGIGSIEFAYVETRLAQTTGVLLVAPKPQALLGFIFRVCLPGLG